MILAYVGLAVAVTQLVHIHAIVQVGTSQQMEHVIMSTSVPIPRVGPAKGLVYVMMNLVHIDAFVHLVS